MTATGVALLDEVAPYASNGDLLAEPTAGPKA
jgi:hypothetical protein